MPKCRKKRIKATNYCFYRKSILGEIIAVAPGFSLDYTFRWAHYIDVITVIRGRMVINSLLNYAAIKAAVFVCTEWPLYLPDFSRIEI